MPWSRSWSFPAWVREGRRPEQWPLVIIPTPPREEDTFVKRMNDIREVKHIMEQIIRGLGISPIVLGKSSESANRTAIRALEEPHKTGR
jgi:hypothetical protein